jgi:hypothetical protein
MPENVSNQTGSMARKRLQGGDPMARTGKSQKVGRTGVIIQSRVVAPNGIIRARRTKKAPDSSKSKKGKRAVMGSSLHMTPAMGSTIFSGATQKTKIDGRSSRNVMQGRHSSTSQYNLKPCIKIVRNKEKRTGGERSVDIWHAHELRQLQSFGNACFISSNSSCSSSKRPWPMGPSPMDEGTVSSMDEGSADMKNNGAPQAPKIRTRRLGVHTTSLNAPLRTSAVQSTAPSSSRTDELIKRSLAKIRLWSHKQQNPSYNKLMKEIIRSTA